MHTPWQSVDDPGDDVERARDFIRGPVLSEDEVARQYLDLAGPDDEPAFPWRIAGSAVLAAAAIGGVMMAML